jgi:multiple sugar transport system ATP-binding protein
LAQIVLKDVVKQFGVLTAVKGVNLQVRDGEFLIMVGPSGCGKTTTLNMISGLERPTSGEIAIGGRVVNDLEPGERGLGMVFQDLALFPHLTVYAAAEAMHISPLLAKRPAQCSGGESQRVALARTIVTNPSVFLMDEPLSSLDAKLRVDMRTELKRLHDRLSATFVYVTHDQAEAMTMADRIVVMSRGVIEQIGEPLEIYRKPATQFVAGFFGTPTMNFLSGAIEASDGGLVFRTNQLTQRLPNTLPASLGGRSVVLGIRSEHVTVGANGGTPGKVQLVEPLGAESLVVVEYGGETPLVGKIDPETKLDTGDNLTFGFDPAGYHLFDAQTGARLN